MDGALFNSHVDPRYKALHCDIQAISKDSSEYQRIQRHVLECQANDGDVQIVNIFSVKRPEETTAFRNELHNQQLLFHGSKVSNFVGLLSRGLLMPKTIVGMGGARTNFGWLGAGKNTNNKNFLLNSKIL